MKFSGKMCFRILLKVTKNQGSTFSIEDKFFKERNINQFEISIYQFILYTKFLKEKLNEQAYKNYKYHFQKLRKKVKQIYYQSILNGNMVGLFRALF